MCLWRFGNVSQARKQRIANPISLPAVAWPQDAPVALDNPAHFGIDRFNGVELLNLLTDGFQLLRLQRVSLVNSIGIITPRVTAEAIAPTSASDGAR
jgi:hypothetical protein